MRAACIALCAFGSAVTASAQQAASKYTERLEPQLDRIVHEAKLPGLAIGVVVAAGWEIGK